MFAVLLLGLAAVVQGTLPVESDCDSTSGEELVVWSHLLCENCKCNNVKGRKNGFAVTSRDDCEAQAKAAGQEYYNYLVDGPHVKVCVFDKEAPATAAEGMSTEESCVTSITMQGGVPNRDEDTGVRDRADDLARGITNSHWKIFKINAECRTTACKNSPTIALTDAGYKCTGLDHIQFRKIKQKRASFTICGQEAHAAGFDYFSYRTDKEYCYYGEHSSSPARCDDANKQQTKNPNWGIYSITCSP